MRYDEFEMVELDKHRDTDSCAAGHNRAIPTADELEQLRASSTESRTVRSHRALVDDDLFVRVTIFMTGLLFDFVPALALVTGVLTRESDPALIILLSLIAVAGAWLMYASRAATADRLDNFVTLLALSDFLIIWGVITMALPITLLIRAVRRRRRDA